MDKLRGKYFALIIGIVLNLTLAIVKLYIGLRTNSLCVLTDSINNFSDTFICIIALVGFLFLLEKPDNKYPFGLGRMEYIISFIMSLILTLVGFSFVYTSLERLFYPRPIWFTWLYFYILLGSVLIKLAMGIYFKWVYRLQKSQVFRIMSVDNFVDFIITTMVLISFVLMNYVTVSVDAVIGLIISIIVIYNSVKFVIDSCSRLLGKNSDSDILRLIRNTVLNFNGIEDVGKIAVHDYGSLNKYAVIEVNFKDDMLLKDIISETDKIKTTIYNNYKINADIVLKGENNGKGS